MLDVKRPGPVGDEIMRQLQAAVRAAGAVTVDGVPMNRSVIIERSGLSRRTAYKILDALPASAPTDDSA